MKITKEAKKQARKLFNSAFQEGTLDKKVTMHIVNTLIAVKPRNFEQILLAFKNFVRLETLNKIAFVESAKPLGPVAEVALEIELKKKHGKDLNIEFKINPELIGGLNVRIGSNVWEGSVQSKINRLSEKFNI